MSMSIKSKYRLRSALTVIGTIILTGMIIMFGVLMAQVALGTSSVFKHTAVLMDTYKSTENVSYVRWLDNDGYHEVTAFSAYEEDVIHKWLVKKYNVKK